MHNVLTRAKSSKVGVVTNQGGGRPHPPVHDILWHFVIWTFIELCMHTFNKTEKLVYN